MTGEAAATVASIQALQNAFQVLTVLAYTEPDYQDTETVKNGSYYDFVIVGGGTAGCVVARRLSQNFTVMMIENGDYPPLETTIPGVFPILPNTTYDYNLTAVADNYTAQNVQGGVLHVTVGNMLGGTSNLHHMIYSHGAPGDYNKWVQATNDSSWGYDELLEYIYLAESLQDEAVLNSESKKYHGTTGPLRLTREPNVNNKPLLDAFKEANISVVDDMSGLASGACEPLLTIADGQRQGNSIAYLPRSATSSNLHIALNTHVTKVLFDSTNTATAVECIGPDGDTVTVYVNKEVIVSAGAIHSPQILMLSGIGPAALLNSLDIPVVADLPVGQGLQDHMAAPLIYTLNASNATVSATNVKQFPVPLATQYKVYDESDTSYPDYMTINLMFPNDSTGFLEVCLNVFNYLPDMCQSIYDFAAGMNMLVSVVTELHGNSSSTVTINTTDPKAPPVISMGYSGNDNLDNIAQYMANFNDIISNTSFYKEVGAKMITLDLCSDYTEGSTEFFKCFGLAVSNTLGHYTGTCAMGTVLDECLSVRGVSKLRVVDASSIPFSPSSVTHGPVTILAEKAAAIIKKKYIGA